MLQCRNCHIFTLHHKPSPQIPPYASALFPDSKAKHSADKADDLFRQRGLQVEGD